MGGASLSYFRVGFFGDSMIDGNGYGNGSGNGDGSGYGKGDGYGDGSFES